MCPNEPPVIASLSTCPGALITASTILQNATTLWLLDGDTVAGPLGPTWATSATSVTPSSGVGTGINNLTNPNGIFVDSNGNVFIADQGNHRIIKRNPTAGTNTVVAGTGGTAGSTTSLLNAPADVWVDGAGWMYVADALNHRILRWTNPPLYTGPGQVLAGIGANGVTALGTALNQFNFPNSIFVDNAGSMFIGDQSNNRAVRWDPPYTTGVLVAGTGTSGTALSQLNAPNGVWVDGTGNVYVNEQLNHRVMRWTQPHTSGNSGTPVAGAQAAGAATPAAGTALDRLSNPTKLSVDGLGNVYVSEAGNHRVTRWSPPYTTGVAIAGSAAVGGTLGGAGASGSTATLLNGPREAFINTYNGFLYVTDLANGRIQRFTSNTPDTITALLPGVYTAVTTPFIGACGDTSNSITILPNTVPTISVTSAPGDTICAGTSVTFTATITGGGTTPLIQWRKNATGTVLGTGTTYTDAGLVNGDRVIASLTSTAVCPLPAVVRDTTTMVVNPTPVLAATATNPAFCDSAAGFLTITGIPLGSAFTLTYTSSVTGSNTVTGTGAGAYLLDSLVAGIYSNIQVVTAAGCSSNVIGPFTLTDPAPPVIGGTSSVNPTTCSGTNGSITLTGLTPSTAYTVEYTLGGTTTAAGVTTNAAGSAVVNGLAAGTYSAISATRVACTSAAVGPITLINPPTPAAPVLSATTPICSGNTLTLTASGPSAAGTTFYTWTGPIAISSTGTSVTVASAPTAAGGTYSATVTVAGCTSAPGTVNVVVDSTPIAVLGTVTGPSACLGTDGSIEITNLPAGTFTTVYTKGATTTTGSATVAGGALLIDSLSSGTYSNIYVVNAACTSNVVGPVTIFDPNLPPPPTATTNSPVCEGTTLSFSASGTPGGTYNWTGPASFSATGDTVTRTPALPAHSGTYSVTVTLANCTSLPTTIGATVNPKPGTPTATNNGPVCEGSTLSFAAATVPGATYLWTGPGVFDTTVQNFSFPGATTAATGVYKAVAFALGCVSDTSVTTAVVNPIPGAPVVADVRYCQGDAAAPLSAGGSNLLWYTTAVGGTGTPVAPVPGTATPGTQVYYVSQTVAACESARDTITVEVFYLPTVTLTPSRPVACQYDTLAYFYTTNAQPTAQYTWTFPQPQGVTVSGGNPYIIRWDSTGSYTVTLVISDNGCSSAPVTVDAEVKPAPSLVFDLKDDVCVGEEVTVAIDSISEGIASYAVDFDGGEEINRVAEGGPYLVRWSTPGFKIVTLQATSNLGCSSLPAYDTLDVHETPVADIALSSNAVLCEGDSLTVTSPYNPTYTYYWSPQPYYERNLDDELQASLAAGGAPVTLRVETSWGCEAFDTLIAVAKPCCDLTLPTAFTPNGDGRNDLFRPVTTANNRITMFRVVNRWGQLVYEASGEVGGWDGTVGGGPGEMATYQYLIRFVCGGKTIEKKGDVTLVR